MTTALSKDDLRHLLRAARPSHSTPSPSYVERREDWLKAAATCARLLLYPPQDEGFHFLVGADAALGLTESPASNLVAGYRDKLGQQSVSVLGIHFLDKLVGRWSRIWVSERWPWAVYPNMPVKEDTDGMFEFLRDETAASEVARCKRFTYSWLFSHLWMRAYWRELRTTATLINAFHDGILSWNRPLHFRWDATNRSIELPGHGTVPFKGDDAGKDFQGIADEFAGAIHRCLQGGIEFSNVLALFRHPSTDKSFRSLYLTNLRVLTNQIHEALSTRAVLKRFTEHASRVRQIALTDDAWHKWLSGSIKVISGTKDVSKIDDLYNRYQGNTHADPHIFLEDAWDKSQSWIEAVYSATINSFSFTGKSGFTLNRISVCGEDLRAFVVVGLCNVRKTNSIALGQVLRDVYEYLHEVVQLAYEEYVISEQELAADKAKREAVTAKKADVSEVSHEIVEIANRLHARVRNWAEPHAVQRWLQVIKSLADQSIHEGLETKYLLGCGPAYISRVRGRLYEPAPNHLLSDSSKGYLQHVTHYLKSYYSLFGQGGKICWFDPEGRFRGVFEYEKPSGSTSNYLRGEIVGHRKFDIFGEQGDVFARYRDGTFSTPQEDLNGLEEKLKGVAKLLLSKWEPNGERNQQFLTSLISKLLRRLDELGVSCGFVVMLASTREEQWPSRFRNSKQDKERLSFKWQYKRLAPPLEHFEGHICSMKDILNTSLSGDKIDHVVKELVPLAKLDGAVLIRIAPNGIFCEAACQVIPFLNGRLTKSPMSLSRCPSTSSMFHREPVMPRCRTMSWLAQNDSRWTN